MFRREIKIQANVLFFMLFSMSYCVLPVWYIEKVTLFVRWLLFNGFLAVSLWLLFQNRLQDKNISLGFPTESLNSY